MVPGHIEPKKRGHGLQRFKDACVASVCGVQNAILGIDFPALLPSSAPAPEKHRKCPSNTTAQAAFVDRLLFASAPFASIQNSASRAKSPEVEVLGSDDAGLHIRAQGATQGNVDASALRRHRDQLGDATSTSLSDLDDMKSDGSSTVVTEEDRAKYSEEKFLVHRVELVGADRELTRLAEEVLQVKENFRCSQADVYDSIRAIQELGYFDEVAVQPVDSRDGITLQFKLSPLPPFQGYRVEGHTMLPPDVVEPIFQGQVGRTSNFKLYQEAVRRIDEWYDKNGILGAVMKDENPYESLGFQNGEFVFKVSEVKLGNISLKFVNSDGEPVKGVTKPKVVTREVRTQSGEIFDQKKLMQTLDGIASTGLFDDVRMVPSERITDSSVGVVEPDEATLDVTIMLQEKTKMRHFTGGMGLSTEGRQTVPIAAVSFSHINLFGNAQKLSASLQFNQLERSFNCEFSDPWLSSGPRHISQVLAISNERKGGDALFARVQGEEPSGDENSDNPASSIAIERLRMSVERSMPLREGVVGTAGLSIMRNRCVGEDGRTMLRDPYQWPLTKSPNGEDNCLKLTASLAYNNLRRGLQSMLLLENAIGAPKAAWRNTWLSFTRATGKVCKEFPIGPVTLRLAGGGGVHHGDCPPYEAHQLGGVNCVRGWAEGGMGTGRNWAQASAETEWSIVDNVNGVVFLDAGSDLNSGQSVLGDPAGARGKDGNGLGYGLGVRIPSPLGPIRLEYAWTNKANWLGADSTLIPRGRFHLGIGARF